MGGAREGARPVAALASRPPPPSAYQYRARVWRDVQEAGRNARCKQAGQARGRVTAIGADETVVRVKGETAFGKFEKVAKGRDAARLCQNRDSWDLRDFQDFDFARRKMNTDKRMMLEDTNAPPKES